ncbi:hypothetical protein HOK51_11500 [Candidatus Woesearchaeota archaeon]|jgi:hypothetical protein|nr:hypothetical protein [Candidatus Woesearchaeota archaeon]MBT6520447.1 hypothetical protein [Candidatus Woesearchaeota archaeon]MBT7367341.1 hypothetical protein [Candidatus Woesearchaeota archaeon]
MKKTILIGTSFLMLGCGTTGLNTTFDSVEDFMMCDQDLDKVKVNLNDYCTCIAQRNSKQVNKLEYHFRKNEIDAEHHRLVSKCLLLDSTKELFKYDRNNDRAISRNEVPQMIYEF